MSSDPNKITSSSDSNNINSKQQEEHEENAKTFSFRRVPKLIHTRWKLAATMCGVSMEQFALDAIDRRSTLTFVAQAQLERENE